MIKQGFRWASGDRKTVWSRKYRKIHLEGTVETWMVEKTTVLHPKSQQVALVRSGPILVMRVFPTSRQFYTARALEPIKHTSYYTFSQSFYGGPGSHGDALGGFSTGRMFEGFDKTYKKSMVLLKRNGFVRA